MTIFSTGMIFSQDVDPVLGFRGLEWGEQMSNGTFNEISNPEFTTTEDLDKVKIVKLINDDYTIGTATLNDIIYFFHDDAGFFKYTLVGNAENSDEMDAILENRLGKNYEYAIQSTETYKIWNIGDVRVEFRKQRSQDFYVTITSDAIAKWQIDMNETINDF